MSGAPMRYGRSIRRNLAGGAAVALTLVVLIGGWATTAEISGAVIASGTLVVASDVKKVQHPTGGVVGQIAVKNGDVVREGDLLIRLDPTITQANLAIVSKGLDELYARRARLLAERDALAAPVFPPELTERSADPAVAALMESERRFFGLRATARAGNASRLKERIQQLNDEVTGHSQQADAKSQEIELIKRELEGARALWKKQLIPLAKLTALEREAARLGGERAQLAARIAEAKGKIAETELQILQIERDFSAEVARELRELDARLGELVERKVAAEDQLQRVELRAPQGGMVHELAVHTVGGVIGPGQVVMLIVPVGDDLAVEAKVKPADIDQLRLGAAANIRFPAFNQRTTPDVDGVLTEISPSITTDPRTGESYYTVRTSLDAGKLLKNAGLKLVPGMPAEVFIKTSSRKAITLVFKPLTDQLNKAFRED
jgi:HlyD family secretion protein